MSSQDNFLERIKTNWQERAGERTTFRAELRVIPRWLVRVMLGLCVMAVAAGVYMGLYAPMSEITQPLVRRVPANVILPTLGMAVLSAFVFLLGYIGADAKRRGMNPALWVLVSLFVPYLIGVILYFVVREPLPLNCPQCAASVNPHFNFCPRCQFNLRPNCPQCRSTARAGDRFCPHCGFALQPDAPAQAGAPTV